MSTDQDVHVVQVPEYFYEIDILYLSHMIADMLGRLTSHNDLIPLTPSTLTRFHSRIPPNITLTDYLRRIIKFTSLEKSCLLIILIYIDRVCERHPQFTISSLTVHRFLITAVTVSSKALSDSYCTNTFYAKIGGITTQELNALELEFLGLIDWHLAATGVMLQQYYANLVDQHPRYKRIIVNPPPLAAQKPSRKRRRRSTLSAISDLDALVTPTANDRLLDQANATHLSPPSPPQQQQNALAASSDDDDDDDDNDNDDNDDDEGDSDEEEARRIRAHFDQLTAQEHINYVA
ncbi:cyclin-domain-containing protein [Gongronella butleri]|nr:cyclin-domain-containing protein [Gongronella butleri]